MLKVITTMIGWLAGSLAALTAVLGGCGFMVVRSHSNLLGFGDFLQYSSNQYVIEGAQFVLYTIIVANETVIRLGVVGVLVVGIPLVLLARSRWGERTRNGWRDRFDPFKEKHGWALSLIFCIVLFSLFFFRLVPYLEDFKEPMFISDLLVAADIDERAANTCAAEKHITSSCIAGSIVRGERTVLEGYYFSLLLHYLETTLLFFLVWRFSHNRVHETLVRLPFTAMFLAFSLLMPMCYGVLVKPAELSPLTLILKNTQQGTPAGELFILQKSADAFLAWNQQQRKIIWYPADSVASAVIGNRQPMFHSQSDAKEGSP